MAAQRRLSAPQPGGPVGFLRAACWRRSFVNIHVGGSSHQQACDGSPPRRVPIRSAAVRRIIEEELESVWKTASLPSSRLDTAVARSRTVDWLVRHVRLVPARRSPTAAAGRSRWKTPWPGFGIAARLGCVAVEFDAMLSGRRRAAPDPRRNPRPHRRRTGQAWPKCSPTRCRNRCRQPFHPAFSGETIPRLIDAPARCPARPGGQSEIARDRRRDRDGPVVGELSCRWSRKSALSCCSRPSRRMRLDCGWLRAGDSLAFSRRSLRRHGHRHRARPWLPVTQPLPARACCCSRGGREEGRSALS